jgi:hypothetical protein
MHDSYKSKVHHGEKLDVFVIFFLTSFLVLRPFKSYSIFVFAHVPMILYLLLTLNNFQEDELEKNKKN